MKTTKSLWKKLNRNGIDVNCKSHIPINASNGQIPLPRDASSPLMLMNCIIGKGMMVMFFILPLSAPFTIFPLYATDYNLVRNLLKPHTKLIIILAILRTKSESALGKSVLTNLVGESISISRVVTSLKMSILI